MREGGEVVVGAEVGGGVEGVGAAVGAAGLGESRNDFFGNFTIKPAGRQVIQKKERNSALHRNIVDAVIHQVCSNGMVNAQIERYFELGSDTIGA